MSQDKVPGGELQLEGPPATLSVLKALCQRGLTPVTDHERWIRSKEISKSDRSAHEMKVIAKVIEALVMTDQLNLPNLKGGTLASTMATHQGGSPAVTTHAVQRNPGRLVKSLSSGNAVAEHVEAKDVARLPRTNQARSRAVRVVGPTSAREMNAKGQSFETSSSLMGKTGIQFPLMSDGGTFFQLPKIQAKAGPNIGHSMSVHSKRRYRRRKDWSDDMEVYPHMKVVPMGWSWSMYFAQRIHQRQAGRCTTAQRRCSRPVAPGRFSST